MAGIRRPDYDLKICTEVGGKGGKGGKVNRYFTKVGVAWLNPSGSISIDMVTMPGVKMYLFPKEYNTEREEGADATDASDETIKQEPF